MNPANRSFASVSFTLQILLTSLVVLTAGCSGREPDQATCSGAYAIYRTALDRGDHARLYRLLDPHIVAKIDRLFENVQTARRLVETLPVPMQAEHIERIGSPAIRRAATREEFLGALVGDEQERGIKANFWMRLTRQYKSCEEVPKGSGEFVAIPMDGSRVQFVRRGDGLLYHVPSSAERVNLQKALVQSARAIARIRQAREALGGGESP
jgi:hypothetical protein